MKAIHIFAILAALLFIVGCTPAKQEPAPVAPVAEPVAEEVPAEPVNELSAEDQAIVDRYTKSCKAGNVPLCIILKNKYDLIVEPERAAANTTA